MNTKQTQETRPPVVVVMGHVDHGKSALLDYIRKTNVVATEAGGITQHISAYEVVRHHDGEDKKITFIDTPGHEAFGAMRARGAKVADIAVLVVSAEDGVKQQTRDALSAIQSAHIPFVVAINKIDLPNANIQKTQSSLIENEIYIEGMGGDIPWVATSAKTGEGIDDLLDTILLVAEMEELTADPTAPARGVVIEAHKDPQRGITATLIIKNGTLSTGTFVVAGESLAPTRLMLDYNGKPIQNARFSSPVVLSGFDTLPATGELFTTYKTKKDAQREVEERRRLRNTAPATEEYDPETTFPLIVRADTKGTLDAVIYEIEKRDTERMHPLIIAQAVGNVSESDVQLALSTGALIIAFNVKEDRLARDLARARELTINHFSIIYELAEWVTQELKNRTPTRIVEREMGTGILKKIFSQQKKSAVIGGTVKEGVLNGTAQLRIERRGEVVGHADILNLQSGKQPVEHISEGSDFGARIQTDDLIAEGDRLVFIELKEE